MHEYRRFIQAQLDERGWRPADLARKSGLSKQLISDVLKDDRDHLGRMPNPSTISALARGFGIAEETVRAAAARSLVDYSDDGTALTITLGEVSTDALLNEIRRRIDHADLSPAAAAPATSEDTQDEAIEDQKTGRWEGYTTILKSYQREADLVPKFIQVVYRRQGGNPTSDMIVRGMIDATLHGATEAAQAAAEAGHPNAAIYASHFELLRRNTNAELTELDQQPPRPRPTRAEASATASIFDEMADEEARRAGKATKVTALIDQLRTIEPNEFDHLVHTPSEPAQDERLAPDSRQSQDLPSGQDGPDRWPDGQPVYNGDDRANWKSWRRAGEPADWETYRDGRREDVELIGGPGAARDLGTEPMGRKIRRRQDVAAEQPDTDGPEGGA